MVPSSLKVTELKSELVQRRVSFKSNAKKAELVAALEGALAAEAATATAKADKGEGNSKGTSKKRKGRDGGEGENAQASSSQSKPPPKSKKPKKSSSSSQPPGRPNLPPKVLTRIKSHLSPFDLRSHLTLAGLNKHIRSACFPDQDAWKELAVGAGYGKALTGVQGFGTGKAGKPGEWRDVVGRLANCRAFGEERELVKGWKVFRDSIRALKDEAPLTPEAVADNEVILETNPLLACISVSPGWNSLAAVSCKFDEAGLDHLDSFALSSLPSVAYAFATCPPVTMLGIEPGFSHVKNPNGVTILDLFTAHLAKGQERVYEESLLTKFVRDQALKTKDKSSWTYQQRTEYERWVLGTSVRSLGWTSRKALMVEPNETFNGEVSQESPGCILFQLGFDGPPANQPEEVYSEDSYSDEY